MDPEHFEALGVTDEHWHPSITDHYRFSLGHPRVQGLLCAPADPAELSELSDALIRGALDGEEERYLMELAALAEQAGC